MTTYFLATIKTDYETAKILFREYAALIDIDLSFQKFDEELYLPLATHTFCLFRIILHQTFEKKGQYLSALLIP